MNHDVGDGVARLGTAADRAGAVSVLDRGLTVGDGVFETIKGRRRHSVRPHPSSAAAPAVGGGAGHHRSGGGSGGGAGGDPRQRLSAPMVTAGPAPSGACASPSPTAMRCSAILTQGPASRGCSSRSWRSSRGHRRRRWPSRDSPATWDRPWPESRARPMPRTPSRCGRPKPSVRMRRCCSPTTVASARAPAATSSWGWPAGWSPCRWRPAAWPGSPGPGDRVVRAAEVDLPAAALDEATEGLLDIQHA